METSRHKVPADMRDCGIDQITYERLIEFAAENAKWAVSAIDGIKIAWDTDEIMIDPQDGILYWDIPGHGTISGDPKLFIG